MKFRAIVVAIATALCVAQVQAGRRHENGKKREKAIERSIAPKVYDPSLVVSVDNWFLDHFIDPFKGDEAFPIPPVIVAENYVAEAGWATGHIQIPELVSALRVDLWHGTRDAVKPFEDQDVTVKAVAKNTQVVSKLRVKLSQVGTTTKAVVEFTCAKKGVSKVLVMLTRRGKPTINFGAIKHCNAAHSQELRVAMRGGVNSFENGKVNPEFNIHDLRGRSYIASKEDATEGMTFHTLHKQYRIVGAPKLEAYAATTEMMTWAKERYSSLGAVVDAFESTLTFSEADIEDDEFYQENVDADEDYEEELQGENHDPYDQSMDSGPLSGRQPTQPPTIKLELAPESHVVREISTSCKPALSGSLMDVIAAKGSATVMHRKDYSEKKLHGFSQAGVLGVHGGLRLELKYNCLHDGISVIELGFDVEPLGLGGKVIKGVTRHRVEMSWLKVCLAEKIAANEIDMMGFNVHLGTFSPDEPAFFPVLNGITTESYTWDGISMQASPEELSTSFNVKLADIVEADREATDEKLDIAEEFIRVQAVRFSTQHRYHRLVEPTLAGHIVNGAIVTPESMPIRVTYNCKASGKVRLGLELLVDAVTLDSHGNHIPLAGRARRVSFYWIKHCSLTHLDQLSVRTVDPDMFTVDASLVMDDVPGETKRLKADETFHSVKVWDKSIPDPLFVATKSTELDRSTLYKVLPEQSTFALEFRKYIGKRHSAKHDGQRDTDSAMGLLFREPQLTSASSNVAVSLRNIGQMELLGATGKEDFLLENGITGFEAKQADEDHLFEKEVVFEVTSRDPIFFVVDHECLAPGPALITLQVPVYTNDNNVVNIQWLKHCETVSHPAMTGHDANFFVAFFVTLAVILTSATCCFYIKKQNDKLEQLRSRHTPEGFDKMEVVEQM